MRPIFLPTLLLASLSVLVLGACSETGQPTMIASAEAATAHASKPLAPKAMPASTGLPALLVHKHESCGCCGAWVDHMRSAGLQVDVRNVEDMQPIKSRLGVPHEMASCHTGEIAGYFIEGHVPAGDVKRLLQERPDANNLGVCMVKTQYSLSDTPSLKGVPTGWRLPVRDVLEYSGARFLCPVAGSISMMPGTGSDPAYRRIDVDTATGAVRGLF